MGELMTTKNLAVAKVILRERPSSLHVLARPFLKRPALARGRPLSDVVISLAHQATGVPLTRLFCLLAHLSGTSLVKE
jgi:hypothetical protein